MPWRSRNCIGLEASIHHRALGRGVILVCTSTDTRGWTTDLALPHWCSVWPNLVWQMLTKSSTDSERVSICGVRTGATPQAGLEGSLLINRAPGISARIEDTEAAIDLCNWRG